MNLLDAGIVLDDAQGSHLEIEVSYESGRGQFVIKPKQALAAHQTFHLRHPLLCENFSGLDTRFDTSFVTTSPTPPPAELGVLTVASGGRRSVYVNEKGTCGASLDTAFVTFAFNAAPAAISYLPLVRWVLEVDGAAWVSTRYGSFDDQIFPSFRHSLSVHGACETLTASDRRDRGLSLGAHSAQLKGYLAGVERPLVTQAVSFSLDCARGAPGTGSAVDGGPVSAPASDPRGGCSAVPGVSVLWLIAAAWLPALRRRCR